MATHTATLTRKGPSLTGTKPPSRNHGCCPAATAYPGTLGGLRKDTPIK